MDKILRTFSCFAISYILSFIYLRGTNLKQAQLLEENIFKHLLINGPKFASNYLLGLFDLFFYLKITIHDSRIKNFILIWTKTENFKLIFIIRKDLIHIHFLSLTA
jgi:hypothetical protein